MAKIWVTGGESLQAGGEMLPWAVRAGRWRLLAGRLSGGWDCFLGQCCHLLETKGWTNLLLQLGEET